MPSPFEHIAATLHSAGAPAALDRLADTLREQKLYHKLFDARLLKRKSELGLPLARPSSLQDVPDAQRKLVEETYVAAAREVGELFLADGDIPAAWMYLQVIREPEKVAAAIEALPATGDGDQKSEQIMQIALYQGVNPTKGVRMMLKAHGTCSTITALDHVLHNLSQEQRQACAKVMVRSLYQDLSDSVRRHVQQRVPMVEPDASLRQLIAGRDWLFEGGGYHIDVSHLGSVVRFARSIDAPAEELELALQMAEYGSRLNKQLQYAGEPPFEDSYAAHIEFFKVLLGRDQDQALQYFRDKLAHEPDEQDKPLLAYVLTDLLMRSGRLDEAVDVAAEHLTNLGDDVSFSFAELCAEARRPDVLRRVAERRGDLVGYTAALIQEQSSRG
jgi:hypothetical protein